MPPEPGLSASREMASPSADPAPSRRRSRPHARPTSALASPAIGPRWLSRYRDSANTTANQRGPCQLRSTSPSPRARVEFAPVALHATTIRFGDKAYTAIALAADAQGISVSQYVREAALIRAVLDELDSAYEALHTAHDLLALAREVRRLAEVEAAGPPRAKPSRRTSGPRRPTER